MIGILIFVDQQMVRARLPAGEHLAILVEQHPDLHLEIGEVHGVYAAHPLLVQPIQGRDRGFATVSGGGRHGGRCDRFVLGLLDARTHQFKRGSIGERGLFDYATEHRDRIAFIQDREVAIETQRLALLTQNSSAHRMEGADPRRPRRGAEQGANAIAHLRGSLIGEGNRQHASGIRVAFSKKVRDTIGQNASLT